MKEFSVASVQFLILELLISVITTVRKSQDYQTVKSSSYFWRWTHLERCKTVSTSINQLTGASLVTFICDIWAQIIFSVEWTFWNMMLLLFSVRKSIQNWLEIHRLPPSHQERINLSVWGRRTRYTRVKRQGTLVKPLNNVC